VSNFRGISLVDADQLGDTIRIAGQNGSGKSCIFDAIRLLKSTYGGYQQNEWQQFFGEFAIQLHGGTVNLAGLFNDSAKPLKIAADFRLRDTEKAFISANAASLLEEAIWQDATVRECLHHWINRPRISARHTDNWPRPAHRRVSLGCPDKQGANGKDRRRIVRAARTVISKGD
jgi:predicted ATPase